MRFGRNLVNWQEIRAFEKTEVAQPCSSTMTDGHQRPPPPSHTARRPRRAGRKPTPAPAHAGRTVQPNSSTVLKSLEEAGNSLLPKRTCRTDSPTATASLVHILPHDPPCRSLHCGDTWPLGRYASSPCFWMISRNSSFDPDPEARKAEMLDQNSPCITKLQPRQRQH